jgi:hypothetical protein
LEEDAKAQGIDAKPFVARWVAERLQYNEGDPRWNNFLEIVNKLKFLLAI